MTWVPLPGQILKGSAIAVQLVWKDDCEKIWVGENEAHVLLCQDSAYRFRADIDLPARPQRVLKLRLVCEPHYPSKRLTTRRFGTWTDTIEISPAEEVLGGPHTTYDLGWTMKLTGLRAGRVRLILKEVSATNPSDHSLMFVLTRYTLDSMSDEVTPCYLDRKWLIRFKSDPASKLLQVGDVDEMPLLCCCCREEIEIAARICQHCKDFAQCYQCFNQEVPTPKRHARHTFRIVFLEHVGVETWRPRRSSGSHNLELILQSERHTALKQS